MEPDLGELQMLFNREDVELSLNDGVGEAVNEQKVGEVALGAKGEKRSQKPGGSTCHIWGDTGVSLV